jgi:hypothetical protein
MRGLERDLSTTTKEVTNEGKKKILLIERGETKRSV